MRRALLVAVLLLAASTARATLPWTANNDAANHTLTGLAVAPGVETSAITIGFVTPGSCMLQSTAINGSVTCAANPVGAITVVDPLTTTGGSTPQLGIKIDNTDVTLNGGGGLQVGAFTGAIIKAAGATATTQGIGAATSVLGVAGSAAARADIACSADGQFVGRSAGAVSCLAVPATALSGATSSANGLGPTAIGAPGVATTFARSDQTPAAYRSDLPLSTTWFVDPVSGSDSAACTSAATACATLQQIKQRWWAAELKADTTVTVVGNIGSTDTGSWNVNVQPIGSATHPVIVILGSLGATTGFGGRSINNTLYTGTVTGFTAASDSPSATDSELTDTAIPASFTASGLMAKGVICQDTTLGVYFWLAKDLGSKTVRISPPALNAQVQLSAALTVGDAYKCFQEWTVPTQDFGATQGNFRFDSVFENTGLSGTIGTGYDRRRTWLTVAVHPIAGRNGMLNDVYDVTAANGNLGGTAGQAAAGFIGIEGGMILGNGSTLLTIGGAVEIGWGLIQEGAAINVDDGLLRFPGPSVGQYDLSVPAIQVTGGSTVDISQISGGNGFVGKNNTSKLISSSLGVAKVHYGGAGATPPWFAGATSDAAPIQIQGTSYAVSALPAVENVTLPEGTPFPSTVFETGGLALLTYGAVPNGSHLQRSGSTIIGDTATYVSAPGSNGLMVWTGSATASRTLTNGDGTISFSNPDGVSGNPEIHVNAIPESKVTNLVTDLAGKQATGNYVTSGAGPVTFSGPGAAATAINLAGGSISNTLPSANIGAASVAYSKIQNETAATLLGNPTGSGAAPSEITLGTGLSFTGSVLNAAGTTYTGLSPIIVNAGTGQISCPTCGTSSGSVTGVFGTTGQVTVTPSSPNPIVSLAAKGAGAGPYGGSGIAGFSLDAFGGLTSVTTATYLTSTGTTPGTYNNITDAASGLITGASVTSWVATVGAVMVSGGLAALPTGDSAFTYDGTSHTAIFTGATPIALLASGAQNISKSNGPLGILTTGADAINLATASTVRFTIDGSGNTFIGALAAGGMVKALPSTGGQLALASSSDVAAALGMPAPTDVLVSTGTTTAPTGGAGLTFSSGNLSVGNSVKFGGLAVNSVLFTDGSGFAATDSSGTPLTYNSSTHTLSTWKLAVSSSATMGDLTTFGFVQLAGYAGGSGGYLTVDGAGSVAVVPAATLLSPARMFFHYSEGFGTSSGTTFWLTEGGVNSPPTSTILEYPLGFVAGHISWSINVSRNGVSSGTLVVQATRNGSPIAGTTFNLTSGSGTGVVNVASAVATGSASSTDVYGMTVGGTYNDGSFGGVVMTMSAVLAP